MLLGTILAAVGCDETLLVGDEPVVSGRASEQAHLGFAGKLASPDSWDAAATGGGRLRVVFVDSAGQQLDRLRVPCGEACVQIAAEVTGGSGRYQFEWEDGSSQPERRVCLDTSTRVALRVTDLGARQESASAAAPEQLLIPLAVESACDAGAPAVGAPVASLRQDAGLAASTRRCMPPADPTCTLAPGIVLPDEVTVDVQGGTIRYFAGGLPLPPGRYRVSYVDGCLTAGDPSFGVGWAVHGTKNMLGVQSCFLISEIGKPLAFTPGSVGAFVGPDLDAGQGAFATYDECVAANCGIAPVDISFMGGKLGVARDGATVLGAIDDLGGEAVGGRSPTFRLTSLDACL